MDNLVSTDWLAARLTAEDLVVIDASMHLPDAGRDAQAEFCDGHIPGARFLDLETFIDTGSAVPKAVPSAEQFAQRLGELGIAAQQRIILYDDSAIRSAARAWFIFHLYGESKVAILDGGLEKWRSEGRALEAGELDHAPRDYSVPEPRPLVASMDKVREIAESGEAQLVDARDAARFAGEAGSGSQGHIPGARNLPYPLLFNSDGTYKAASDIRQEFERAGIDLSRPIVTTCNSGMTAAVLLYGLERAGANNVSLYDGSWLEWGGDLATPKETGGAAEA